MVNSVKSVAALCASWRGENQLTNSASALLFTAPCWKTWRLPEGPEQTGGGICVGSTAHPNGQLICSEGHLTKRCNSTRHQIVPDHTQTCKGRCACVCVCVCVCAHMCLVELWNAMLSAAITQFCWSVFISYQFQASLPPKQKYINASQSKKKQGKHQAVFSTKPWPVQSHAGLNTRGRLCLLTNAIMCLSLNQTDMFVLWGQIISSK